MARTATGMFAAHVAATYHTPCAKSSRPSPQRRRFSAARTRCTAYSVAAKIATSKQSAGGARHVSGGDGHGNEDGEGEGERERGRTVEVEGREDGGVPDYDGACVQRGVVLGAHGQDALCALC